MTESGKPIMKPKNEFPLIERESGADPEAAMYLIYLFVMFFMFGIALVTCVRGSS